MPKEAHFKYRKRAKEVHPSGSAIQAEKKGTSSVALQVPFWATWDITSPRAHFSVTIPRGQSLFDNGHRKFLQGAPTVTHELYGNLCPH